MDRYQPAPLGILYKGLCPLLARTGAGTTLPDTELQLLDRSRLSIADIIYPAGSQILHIDFIEFIDVEGMQVTPRIFCYEHKTLPVKVKRSLER